MNIILMYLRKKLKWNPEKYLLILLKHNENFIKRYIGSKWGTGIYTTRCIDIFPLSDKDLQRIKGCMDNRGKNDYAKHGHHSNSSERCMHCWIDLLEDIDSHLKPKDPPKFLKKKEIPKFLQKR